KVALITGSAGGIGKAIAKKFIEEGACVLLNDVNPERLEDTKKEFEKAYGRDVVRSVTLDVTKESDIDHAFSTLTKEFGGVDIIVNNAGLSISKTIEDHSEKDWDILYDVLAKGQF